jgi:transposase
MERKSARRIHSKETHDRVLSAYQNGEDWHIVADTLHVPRRTANQWISDSNHNITRNKHGGKRRPQRLAESEIDQLADWLGDDATMTLEKMRLSIRQTFNKDVCLKTISNYLHNRCIRVKKLYHVSETMNSPENKRRRKLFVDLIQYYELEEKYIIWMDESMLFF